MGLFGEKQIPSLDANYPHTGEYDDDLHVECPPHTTERELVTRIDWRVIPCLCVM